MLIIVISIFLCIISIFYIQWKLRSRFWSRMPMLFYHTFYLLLNKHNTILDIKTMRNTKLENSYNITTTQFVVNDLTDNQIFEILNFIKHHHNSETYIQFSNEIICNPNIFLSQFNGTTSYISTYNLNPLIHNKVLHREGNILNKTYNICIDSKNIQTTLFTFLSTKRDKSRYKVKNITGQLLYNSLIHVMKNTTPKCVFYTHKKLTNVIPLVTYNSFIFNIKYFSPKPYDKFYKLTRINTSNFNILKNLLDNKPKCFKLYLLPEISNIYEMIKHNNLYIFIVNFNNDCSSIYIFKNTLELYNGKKMYALLSSILFKKNDNVLFINNLFNCIDYLKKNEGIDYVSISNTSNNTILLKELKIKYKEVYKYQQYWYMVNYILYPVSSNNVLLIY